MCRHHKSISWKMQSKTKLMMLQSLLRAWKKWSDFFISFKLLLLLEQLTLNQRVPGSSPCWCTKNRLFGGGFLKAAPKRLICSEDSRKDTSRLETQKHRELQLTVFLGITTFLTALFWNPQNFPGNNIRQNSTQNIEQKGHAATSLRLQFEKAACPEYHFKEKSVNM